MKIDLQAFCANERDMRRHLQAPFELDGFVYATNGHWMIRVPAAYYGGHRAFVDGLHPKRAAILVGSALASAGEFLPLPEIAEPKMCTACSGSGEHVYRDEIGPEDCFECDGRGRERGVIAIGDSHYARHYVWRLRKAIPGVRIKTRGAMEAASIEFDGGHGLLMPCMP